MPAWNPPPVEKLGLHAPHHAAATYCVPPIVTASSADTWAAALAPVAVRTSKMGCQSVDVPVPVVVPAMPASEFHTIAPPATMWLGLVRSMTIGAMKRGSGSAGAMECQFAPPSVDLETARFTYSVMTFWELAGSTRVYPPSPPGRLWRCRCPACRHR